MRIAAELIPMPAWITDVIPAACIRCPLHVAVSLATGKLGQMLLPVFDDAQSLRVSWQTLGIQALPMSEPVLPIDEVPSIDAAFALRVANLLRDIAGPAIAAHHDPESIRLRCMEACSVLQQYHDSLDPRSIRRAAKEVRTSRGDETGIAAGRRAAFKVVFMAQCLMACSLLQSDSRLRESIERSLGLLLPHQLRKPVHDLVELKTTPSPSAISRWRLLLDVAYMQYRRKLNRGRRWSRWLMLDSSPQGGNDYEMIIVCSAAVDAMPRIMFNLDSLLGVRRSAALAVLQSVVCFKANKEYDA